MSQGLAYPGSTTPLSGHWAPQAGRRSGSSAVVLERMVSGVRGHRSHTSSNMPGVPIACQSQIQTHTHTHTPEGPSLQALCRSTPINFLGIPSQLFLRPQYCPQEKSLSQMPQGFDLYSLIPLLARSVRGMEAQTITLSSTFSPSLLGAYQMISSPHLTASDRLTWGGTTCPKMHSSITTHHFPQAQSIRNGAGCVAFWD